MPLLHTRYRPLRSIWPPWSLYPAANDSCRLPVLSTRGPWRSVRITTQLLRQWLSKRLLQLKELSMNNYLYDNGFSITTTCAVRVRRLDLLPDLLQPVTTFLFAGRAFPLY